MDKQQEQMTQNPNQEVEYTSGFLDEDEVVNESEFEEQPEEQEVGKVVNNQQKKSDGEEQPKKVRRPRKTIEQEIAELDAKRERLMEKKRRQDAHEKIVFGSVCINTFRKFCHIKENQKEWETWKNKFREFTTSKDKEILERIFNEIDKYNYT